MVFLISLFWIKVFYLTRNFGYYFVIFLALNKNFLPVFIYKKKNKQVAKNYYKSLSLSFSQFLKK